MDPMEDVQMSQQGNAAHRYQCQQPQVPAAPPPFGSPNREGQRYDPVHDSEAWIRRSRPSYPATQNPSHWQPSSYMPVPHWQTYGEPQRPNPQNVEAPAFRGSRTFMDQPWNEVRTFESAPFGYNHYGGSFSNGAAAEPNNGSNNNQNLNPPMPSQFTTYNIHAVHPAWDRSQYGRPPPATPLSARRNEETSAERAARHHQPVPPTESQHRYSASAARRAYRARGFPESWGGSPRRLAMHMGLEGHSDEEDDEATDAQFRRHAELLFNSEDEERSIAAMRGAVTMGKKITSKDFISKLETVPLDQIPENERNCSICYETIGTANPEGTKEKAIRLPKCKHIFGDICFKKWCQDSDTCPYCRDKLPSEYSIKKGFLAEYRAAQRMRTMNRRQASSIIEAGAGYSHDAASLGALFNNAVSSRTYELSSPHRPRDEYQRPRPFNDDLHNFTGDDAPAGFYESWGASPPSNRPGTETFDRPSERRRTTRGRLGNGRAAHPQGRPTSVGSSRFISTTITPSRAQVPQPQLPNFGSHRPPRSITPALTREDSNPDSLTGRTTATQELLLALEAESRSEEASPTVAVGSGSSRDRDETTQRRTLENYGISRNDEWSNFGSPPRISPPDSGSSVLGSPFREVHSPLVHPEDENFATGPIFDRSPASRWSR